MSPAFRKVSGGSGAVAYEDSRVQSGRRDLYGHALIVTVVTDFEVHGMWLATPSDHYFVATSEAEAHLQSLGIAPSAITVSGDSNTSDIRREKGPSDDAAKTWLARRSSCNPGIGGRIRH